MTQLPDNLLEPFGGPNIAHVATLLPDGAPHTVPVWVGIEAGRVAFLTSPRSCKARNLKADPRVAISVTQRDRPTTIDLMRGHVSECLRGEQGWAIIDRISHKYIGGPYPLREDRVAFLVQVEHAFAQTFE